MGMSTEEAEAEAAWDPTETDPKSGEFAFDDIYSVDDALPSEMRGELMRPGYGPEAIIAAGFRLEEYAIIRCTLDAIGASHLKLLIADETLLHSNLDTALTTPEIDWQAPRPPDWIRGGAWGSRRVILFSGLSVAQQGALVEVLEGQGIDNIAVCANVPEASSRIVGEILAEAVQAVPPKPRGPRQDAEGAAAPPVPVPQWAEDADPSHVAAGGLPSIAEELKGRMKTVSDHVAHAETVGDIDLSTGLSEEDRARREAFLQELLPKERVAEYVREAARAEQREAQATPRGAQEARGGGGRADAAGADDDVEADSVAGAVAEAVASVSAEGARAADVNSKAQRAAAVAESTQDSAVSAAVSHVSPVATEQDTSRTAHAAPSATRDEPGMSAPPPVGVPEDVPAAVRAEVMGEYEESGSESEHEGLTIDMIAEPGEGAEAAGADAAGAGQHRSSTRPGVRARRRGRSDREAAGGGTREIGLDDLIADDGDAAGFDDAGFVDTWLHGSSSGSAEAASRQGSGEASERAAAGQARAPAVGAAAEAAARPGPAEDATMDAISRALKSGVDKETLKRYIDEMAEQVADSAGSWLKDVPPDDGTPGANTEAAARLGSALRGSQGAPLQYGPQAPPQRGWDMREEVRAENAARAAAGAPLATDVSGASPTDTPPMGAPPSGAPQPGSAPWQEDARCAEDTPYAARKSIGHLDPMDGDGDADGEPTTADAVRALAQGLGMAGEDDENEFPWLEEDLGTESRTGGGSTAQAAPPHMDAGVYDIGGGAGAGAADFDDVPGWKFDGFEGMDSAAASAVADASGDDRADAPQQINEADVEEQVGAARPATLAQLKMAAERHGLDLQELLADARRRGVQIDDE